MAQSLPSVLAYLKFAHCSHQILVRQSLLEAWLLSAARILAFFQQSAAVHTSVYVSWTTAMR